jgi:hypothetical protein
MDKMSNAINELVRLLSKNRRLRRVELVRALSYTLEGLDGILEDENFFQSAEIIGQMKDQSKGKVLITSIRKFQDAFLSIENRALKNANIDKGSRKVIIKILRFLRKDVDALVSSNRPLRKMAEETRTIVIELLESLEKPDEDFQIKHGVEKKLRKVVALASGAVIIGANVSISAANPVTSAISVSFGSALIGKNL